MGEYFGCCSFGQAAVSTSGHQCMHLRCTVLQSPRSASLAAAHVQRPSVGQVPDLSVGSDAVWHRAQAGNAAQRGGGIESIVCQCFGCMCLCGSSAVSLLCQYLGPRTSWDFCTASFCMHMWTVFEWVITLIKN